jgi:hypothetical protein
MNIKRALAFSLMLWAFIFVAWSIVMFIPALKDKLTAQHIVNWVLLIPMALLLAKWYFKKDSPSVKKGLYLGFFSLVIGAILDLAITISLFIGPQQGGYMAGLTYYYTRWELWVGFVWFLVLMIFAGFEYDCTFTKDVVGEVVEGKKN